MATLRPWWPLRLRQAQSLDERRWVILDVETSGLDPAKDALLAIAAVAMRVDWAGRRLRMDAGDSLELVLRPDAVSSRGNILLHGIGAHMQQTGLEPDAALQTFVAFVGAAPLLAFHSAFDQTVLDRYCQRHLGKACSNPWLDIAHLCAATHPDVHARSLDEWMAHFRVTCAVRHQAAADAWAEGELLQRIWPRVVSECASWRDVSRLAQRHRWLSRG